MTSECSFFLLRTLTAGLLLSDFLVSTLRSARDMLQFNMQMWRFFAVRSQGTICLRILLMCCWINPKLCCVWNPSNEAGGEIRPDKTPEFVWKTCFLHLLQGPCSPIFIIQIFDWLVLGKQMWVASYGCSQGSWISGGQTGKILCNYRGLWMVNVPSML